MADPVSSAEAIKLEPVTGVPTAFNVLTDTSGGWGLWDSGSGTHNALTVMVSGANTLLATNPGELAFTLTAVVPEPYPTQCCSPALTGLPWWSGEGACGCESLFFALARQAVPKRRRSRQGDGSSLTLHQRSLRNDARLQPASSD
ncbi:MAG: hypothetical protein R3E33_06125 [Rhodocyclaceae bacterium]